MRPVLDVLYQRGHALPTLHMHPFLALVLLMRDGRRPVLTRKREGVEEQGVGLFDGRTFLIFERRGRGVGGGTQTAVALAFQVRGQVAVPTSAFALGQQGSGLADAREETDRT